MDIAGEKEKRGTAAAVESARTAARLGGGDSWGIAHGEPPRS